MFRMIAERAHLFNASDPGGYLTVIARPCGEGILPLLCCVEGVAGSQTRTGRVWGPWPSNRGQDARDTQGRDALATGLRDGI